MAELSRNVNLFFYGKNFVLPLIPEGYSWQLHEEVTVNPIEVSLSVVVDLDALHRDGYVLDVRNLNVFGGENFAVLASDNVATTEDFDVTQRAIDKVAAELEVDLLDKAEAKIDELIESDVMRKVLVSSLSELPPSPTRPSFLSKLTKLLSSKLSSSSLS